LENHLDGLVKSQKSPSPLIDCFTIQKSDSFLPVMPDLIRHPEMWRLETALDSGSSPEWRNSNICRLANCDTVSGGRGLPWRGRPARSYLAWQAFWGLRGDWLV